MFVLGYAEGVHLWPNILVPSPCIPARSGNVTINSTAADCFLLWHHSSLQNDTRLYRENVRARRSQMSHRIAWMVSYSRAKQRDVATN